MENDDNSFVNSYEYIEDFKSHLLGRLQSLENVLNFIDYIKKQNYSHELINKLLIEYFNENIVEIKKQLKNHYENKINIECKYKDYN